MTERRELGEFVERAARIGQQARIDAAAAEAISAFDVAGIESILLKGPVLARTLYREDEHRSYSDVDLLVPLRAVPTARGVLSRLGYTAVGDWFNRAAADEVPHLLHGEPWGRTVSAGSVEPTLVDLHWHLEGCDAPPDVVWSVLAAHRRSIEIGGRHVDALSTEALALHLALHAEQHGPEGAKPRADLRRGIERWPLGIWRAASALATRLEAGPAFASGLRLLPEGETLAGALRLPDADAPDAGAVPRGSFHLAAMAQARGAGKLAMLRWALLPASGWIRAQFPWARRGRASLLAAYAVHLSRAPAWAARAWRYRRRAGRPGG